MKFKKIMLSALLAALSVSIYLIGSVAIAEDIDLTSLYCTYRGYTVELVDDSLICDFGDGTYCPLDEFYNEECGTDYQAGLGCESPYIYVDGQCVDPLPACEELPENAVPASCVDKLFHDGSKIKNYSFSCMDGYEKVDGECVGEYKLFSDLDSSYKNYGAITYLHSIGILDGYDDGTFKPENTVNRAEMMKIVIEAIYPEMADGENCFPDVIDQWFAPYVCFAKEKGMISGYSDGTFKPEQPVNYVEALKITIEGYGFIAGDDTQPWYQKYINYAESSEFAISDHPAEGALSRGDMAEIIFGAELHSYPVPEPA